MPPTFIGSADADGVALSVDGVNWFRVVSLTDSASTSTDQLHTFDLSDRVGERRHPRRQQPASDSSNTASTE